MSGANRQLKTIPGGLVIMIDGLDGVGKTTQIDLIKTSLAGNWLIRDTRVSGGTPIGEKLRKVMLSNTARSKNTDLYIAMAMYSSLAEQMLEWRNQGSVILVDRSPLSMVAYQSFAEKVDLKLVESHLSEAFAMLLPDSIIIYDLDIKEALLRNQAKETNDFFDNQDEVFFNNVRAGYLYCAQRYLKLVKLLDINGQSVELVKDQTLTIINNLRPGMSLN